MISGSEGASVNAMPATHSAITRTMKRRRPNRPTAQPVHGVSTEPTR